MDAFLRWRSNWSSCKHNYPQCTSTYWSCVNSRWFDIRAVTPQHQYSASFDGRHHFPSGHMSQGPISSGRGERHLKCVFCVFFVGVQSSVMLWIHYLRSSRGYHRSVSYFGLSNLNECFLCFSGAGVLPADVCVPLCVSVTLIFSGRASVVSARLFSVRTNRLQLHTDLG